MCAATSIPEVNKADARRRDVTLNDGSAILASDVESAGRRSQIAGRSHVR